MNSDASFWIEHLQLTSHPEGGYYRETYRSDESIDGDALPARYNGDRSFGTSIYFLLTSDNPSNFHKVESDELWFFHKGSPVTVHVIDEEGVYTSYELGGEEGRYTLMVKRGGWFGSTVEAHDSFGLCSCVVVPGFEFDDFTLANRSELLKLYPQHQEIIARLSGDNQ